MGTIKFRAFNNGKMIYQTGALASLKRFFRVIGEDVKPMQFTGLTDKNGKELYLDDIIRIKISGIAHEPNYKWISKVNWYETHAMFGFTTKHGWLSFSHQHFVEFEIIGNIYETPELLTR